MNSMSKRYNDECRKDNCRKDDYRRDDYRKDDYKKEEEKCPTIIKCSGPSSTPIPVLTLGEGISNVELPLASITLDTSCICDPIVKLDFSTNYVVPISVSLIGGSIVLRVFKQCKNQANRIQVGTSWAISGGLAGIEIFEASIASFSTCDSDFCGDECCTYTVVATVNAIADVALGAAFNNSTLSAVVTCKNSCHKCKEEDRKSVV